MRPLPGRTEAPQRLEHRVGLRLVALRVLCSDHDLHRVAQHREPVERELDRAEALRRHDAEPTALVPEHAEQVDDVGERLQPGVERLVVRPVRVDQLVDAVGVEVAHLRDQPRPADRRAHQLLVRFAAEDGERGVLHRGQDDRPGVDQGAVEVEEDDVAHAVDRSQGRDSPG